MCKNLDIRASARGKGVYLYEVASVLGISEPTIMRWLRAELTDERRAAILEAIDRVAASRAAQSAATATE